MVALNRTPILELWIKYIFILLFAVDEMFRAYGVVLSPVENEVIESILKVRNQGSAFQPRGEFCVRVARSHQQGCAVVEQFDARGVHVVVGQLEVVVVEDVVGPGRMENTF